ncbi:MAG: DUF222 domain-containing protein [Mycobacteriales bacterium]
MVELPTLIVDPQRALDHVLTRPASGYGAALLETVDVDDLPAADRVRLLQAWARIEAHAAAQRLALVRAVAGADERDPAYDEFGAHEVALALRIPLGAAYHQVSVARRLATHLPRAAAALESGDLAYAHVLRMARAVGTVDAPVARAAEEQVLPRHADRTPGELATALTRAVARVDADGFARRHQRAAAQADVELIPDADAMAWISAHMPLQDAVAVKQRVDAEAAAAKAAGDPRPIGLLRAMALRALVEAGYDDTPAAPLPTGSTSPAETSTPSTPPSDTSTPTGSPSSPPADTSRAVSAHEIPVTDPAPRRPRKRRPVEIQLVATPAAWLGLAQTPAELPGFGPIPINVARELAPDAKLRRLVCDPDSGALLDYGRRTYRVPAPLADFVRARHPNGMAPGSTTPVVRHDLDHVIAWDAGGKTSVDNVGPLPRGWHRAKTAGVYRLTLVEDGIAVWDTPRGQRACVEPFDYRLGP